MNSIFSCIRSNRCRPTKSYSFAINIHLLLLLSKISTNFIIILEALKWLKTKFWLMLSSFVCNSLNIIFLRKEQSSGCIVIVTIWQQQELPKYRKNVCDQFSWHQIITIKQLYVMLFIIICAVCKMTKLSHCNSDSLYETYNYVRSFFWKPSKLIHIPLIKFTSV